MSQQNNEMNGAAIVIGIVCAIAYVLFSIVAVLVSMVCVVFTILSIVAWVNGGLKLFGQELTVSEARMFLLRGVGFAIFVPIFWALLMAFMDQPNTAPLNWLVIGGYVFGSAGLEIIDAWETAKEEQRQQAIDQFVMPPLPEETYYLPPVMPTIEPVKPFQFASWEDEESRR
jgi:hypothetical protein